MVAYTTAKDLAQPLNSSFVGTWDVPVNSNWGIIDAALGQITTVSLNNSPVTLSPAQFQCFQIIFNSTLTGNVAITFPSTFTGPYSIQHNCTGSSAFVITLQTTIAGGQVIGCSPGEAIDVMNDGTNLKFRNLGRVGSYWDYAGSSVPAWVSACTVPPYLNCDGTTFSSATYPQLARILNGVTLPDARGRFRATLNQGQGRITSGSSTGGVDGDTLFASGGSQTTTLSSQNVPPVPYTDPGHTHGVTQDAAKKQSQALSGGGAQTVQNTSATITINSGTVGITIGSTSPTNFSAIPPAYIGGLTMIRAA